MLKINLKGTFRRALLSSIKKKQRRRKEIVRESPPGKVARPSSFFERKGGGDWQGTKTRKRTSREETGWCDVATRKTWIVHHGPQKKMGQRREDWKKKGGRGVYVQRRVNI